MKDRKEDSRNPEEEDDYGTLYEAENDDGNKMTEENITSGENLPMLELLVENATDYYRYTDAHRKKYKKRVSFVAVSTAVLYPTALFLMLPGSETIIGRVCHWFGMGSILLITIIYGISRAIGWDEKYKQRTATYLRLDEFLRGITFRPPKDEKQLQKCVDEYLEIVRRDNEAGEANALLPGQYLEDKAPKAVKKLE